MSRAITAVTIPKWGMEMEEGTISRWLKQVGDAVVKGEELVEIESDKVLNAMDAPAAGQLRRILADASDSLAVGTLIAVLADANVDEAEIDQFIHNFKAADVAMGAGPAAAPRARPETPVIAASVTRPQATSDARLAARTGPVVQRLALELAVDLATVAGSGRDGRILQSDVRRAAGAPEHGAPAASTVSSAYRSSRLSATRRSIARRMQEATQTVPHFYLTADLRLDTLLAARGRLIPVDGAEAPTITEMLIWAVGRALRDVPAINVQLVGDELRQFDQSDIAVAVATEQGLLAPVLRAVDQLTLQQLSVDMRALAERTRTGALTRADLSGGTITVSNLGMLGIDRFTAIITPPQCSILAVGRATRQMVVSNDAGMIATVMSCTLSCDHRVIDGAVGARFLAALRQRVESEPGALT